MAIYSGFSHQKWWFSIVTLVYQRVKFDSWPDEFHRHETWCCSCWFLLSGNEFVEGVLRSRAMRRIRWASLTGSNLRLPMKRRSWTINNADLNWFGPWTTDHFLGLWQIGVFSAQFYCHVDKGHDEWHHRIRGFCLWRWTIHLTGWLRGIIEMEKSWPAWPRTYKRITKNDNMNWHSQLVWLNSIATCNTFVPWLKSGAGCVPHFQMAGLGGSPLRCLASQLERRLVTNCCCTLVPHFCARSIIWLLLLLLLFCCCCCCCCFAFVAVVAVVAVVVVVAAVVVVADAAAVDVFFFEYSTCLWVLYIYIHTRIYNYIL